MPTTVELIKASALTQIQTDLTNAVAASATSATNSAAQAATSATTALNAISQAFKGGVAGASVPATSTLAGDTYRITSAGTSQSKTWVIGDAAIYNGTSGSWTQLPGYYSVLDATLAPFVASRVAMPGLNFNGVAGATLAIALGVIGTGDFTLAASITPTSFPGTSIIIGGATGAPALGLNSGVLAIFKSGSAATLTAPSALTLNVPAHVAYTRTGTTGTLYVNGVSVASGADTNNYTVGIGTVGQIAGSPSINFLGTIAQPLVLNRAMSGPEVAVLFKNDQLSQADILTVPAVNQWGTGNAGSLGAADANSVATIGVFQSTVAATAGARTAGAGAFYLTATRTAATWQIWFGTYLPIRVGQKYAYSFWAKSANAPINLTFGLAQAGVSVSNIDTYTLTSSWAQYTGTFTTTGSGYADRLSFAAANQGVNGNTYDIDDVQITPLGAVILPDATPPGAGYQWKDASGNFADIILPAAGVTWSQPNATPVSNVRGQIVFSASGNQLFLGQISVPVGARLSHIRVKASTGTPTITVGSTSAGTDIVASVAISSTVWTELTILQRTHPTGNIWINSSAAQTLSLDIGYQPSAY